MALVILPGDRVRGPDGGIDRAAVARRSRRAAYLPAAAARARRPRRRRRGPAAPALPRRAPGGRARMARADTTVGAVDRRRRSRPGRHLLPPLPDLRNAASPWGLAWLVARLRAPGGCPWDREQDHRSLRPFLLEEAYEVYDALEDAPGPKLAEELGDLLLQIVLHAEHAAEAGIFDLSDVQRSIMTKIVRRHPHVFGDGAARTVGRGDACLGGHQGRRAGARARRGLALQGAPTTRHARRVRRAVAVPARARLRERDAGAGRQPGLRLARPRGRHRQGRRGGHRAAAGERSRRSAPRSTAT